MVRGEAGFYSVCIPTADRNPSAPYPWHVHPATAKIIHFSTFPAVQCDTGTHFNTEGLSSGLVLSSAHLWDQGDSHGCHISLPFLLPPSFLLETSTALEATAVTLHRVTSMGQPEREAARSLMASLSN